jgi:tRNA(fMet)-specific endonuclease VapC
VITYLLDTNIMSYLMRAKPVAVTSRLRQAGPHAVAVSVITAIELRAGANLSAHARRYHQQITTLFASIPVLPLPIAASDIAGRLMSSLKKSGQSFGDFDMLIASHALTGNLTLVTNDAGFGRISGLRIENWV